MKKLLLVLMLFSLFSFSHAANNSGPVQVGFIVYMDFQFYLGGIYTPKQKTLTITQENIKLGSKITLMRDGEKILTIDSVSKDKIIQLTGKPGAYEIVVE